MNNSAQLVVIRNPFDRRIRDERSLPLDALSSVADILSDNLPLSGEVSVAIDGELITREEWAARTLQPGEQLVVMPVVHGGDNILGSIMMIAVAVFAPQIAFSAYSAMGGTMTAAAFGSSLVGGLMTMGVGMLGSMVVGGLMGPQKQNLPSRGLQSYDNSPTYSWSPATTQQPGGVINRAYGLHKLYGNIIAGYVESRGNTGQEQIAHLLVDLGMGPYQRLYDYKINDQPVGYYSGVAITSRLGHLNQSIIPAFNDTRLNRQISAKVVKGTPVLRDTVGSDYDALEIVLLCPNGLWYANDTGGMDVMTVLATVEISDDGGATWNHVALEPHTVVNTVRGYWSFGYWTSSNDAIRIWHEVSKGSSIHSDHIEGALDTMPGGYPKRRWRWMDVDMKIATTVSDSIVLSGNTQQPVRRVLRIDNLTRGVRYKVRVSNLSIDQTSSRYGEDLYLSEIKEVMYDDFQYPRTVLVGVDALGTNQLSGSIKFSCMAEAAIVRVWDGASWSSQWTRNPAWIIWDVLTQPVLDNSLNVVRYDGMQPSRLLPYLSTYKAFADFCDTLVPDGKGGMEKRCCWDGVFDTPTSAWEAALEVAATARAQLVPIGTSIMVVFDDVRATPAQLFSVGNTAVDSFTETFLPMQDRAASIEVKYTNLEQDYTPDTLTVVNTAITESAAQRISIGLRGVTRSSQSWREAMWRLKRNELLKRSGSIGVDIDALACTVGDMIWVQNDVTLWGVGGLAASGSTTTSLQLDKSITLEVGITYELKLRLSDDTLVSRTITTAAGTVTAVDVSEAFPSAPAPYDVWAIGETGKAVKEFLVLDVQRDGNQRAKLALIEYNATLYGLDSGIPALPTPNVSASGLPSVINLRVEEIAERTASGDMLVHLDVRFDLSNAAKALVFEGGQQIGETATSQFRRQNVALGASYVFEVRPVGFSGESPADTWQTVAHTVSLFRPGGISPVVTSAAGGIKYRVTESDADYVIAIEAKRDPSISGYEMRTGTSFYTGTMVAESATGTFTVAKADALGNTYYIRARYLAGGYSSDETMISVTDAAMPQPVRNVRWSVAEPNLVWSWDASPDAASYLIFWEDGGVARRIEQTVTTLTVPIPRWASAQLRVYAVSMIGFRSQAVDEELTINGRYVYNEVVNASVPLNSGTYVNMAHVSANQVMKPSILGVTPSLPISDANDADLYTLGYNWQTGAGSISSFSATPVANFRNDFWREESGYFESAVIDLGAIYTGIMMLNIAKSITDYGAQGVSVYGKALVEYLNDRPIRALVDNKAFLTARFFVATDSALSANWKEARQGETVSARYCRVVIEALHVSPLVACTVTSGTIYIDVPDIAESGKATGVTTGNTVINLTKPFKVITTAMATARGAAKAEVVATSIGTPCTLTIKTNSTTPSDVDWFVKGY